MKVTIERSALLKALKTVTMIARKDVIDHTDQVVIRVMAETGQVRFAASDFLTKVVVMLTALEVTADIGEDASPTASVAVEARKLLRLVTFCRGETVELYIPTGRNINMEIISGAYHFITQVSSSENVAAKLIVTAPVHADAPGLLKAARHVMYASSREESRPVLQGVLFNGSVTASDGFRIAQWQRGIEGVSGLIPARFLEMASRVYGRQEPRIAIEDKVVSLSNGVVTMSTILIDGTFPDISAIIPRKQNLVVEFDTAELLGVLRTVSEIRRRFNSSGWSSFQLSIDAPVSDDVKLQASIKRLTVDEVTFKSTIDAKLISRADEFNFPFEIGFNADLMIDSLVRCGDRVMMVANAHNTPAILKPVDQSDPWFAVVMPIHVG